MKKIYLLFVLILCFCDSRSSAENSSSAKTGRECEDVPCNLISNVYYIDVPGIPRAKAKQYGIILPERVKEDAVPLLLEIENSLKNGNLKILIDKHVKKYVYDPLGSLRDYYPPGISDEELKTLWWKRLESGGVTRYSMIYGLVKDKKIKWSEAAWVVERADIVDAPLPTLNYKCIRYEVILVDKPRYDEKKPSIYEEFSIGCEGDYSGYKLYLNQVIRMHDESDYMYNLGFYGKSHKYILNKAAPSQGEN